jgi:hypothetical protein
VIVVSSRYKSISLSVPNALNKLSLSTFLRGLFQNKVIILLKLTSVSTISTHTHLTCKAYLSSDRHRKSVGFD